MHATALFPPLMASATPEECANLLHAAFGDDVALMSAIIDDDWQEACQRLQPYAQAFPAGSTVMAPYSAPAITPEMLAEALAHPLEAEASALKVTVMRYCVAGRLRNWLICNRNSQDHHGRLASETRELMRQVACGVPA